jgi:anti-sigma factor RsiW
MTGRIIPLHGDHDEAQALMPWYVTGALDAADRAKVEAHLGACPECQAELRLERRLEAEVAGLTFDVEQGWTALRGRLDIGPPRRMRGGVRAWLGGALAQARRWWRASPPWLGWALAAQGAALVMVGVLAAPAVQPARYHALGAAPASAVGNVVVIFRPDTRESALRATLRASRARLVDGPTAADAYLVHVPAGERPAILATLRGQADVVLAEPVDSGGPP